MRDHNGSNPNGAFSDSHESGITHHSDEMDRSSPSPAGYGGYQQQQNSSGGNGFGNYGQPTAAGPPAIKGQGLHQPINNNNNNNMSGSSSGLQGVAGMVRKKLGNFVGFANLPDQVHRRSVRSVGVAKYRQRRVRKLISSWFWGLIRRGFQFTAMVVGMSSTYSSPLDRPLLTELHLGYS